MAFDNLAGDDANSRLQNHDPAMLPTLLFVSTQVHKDATRYNKDVWLQRVQSDTETAACLRLLHAVPSDVSKLF